GLTWHSIVSLLVSRLIIYYSYILFFLMLPRPPRFTLFPYTTLFRSLSRRSICSTISEFLESRFPVGSSARRIFGSLMIALAMATDRKSTRLNSSHVKISYAVFCLKKKKKTTKDRHKNSSSHFLTTLT